MLVLIALVTSLLVLCAIGFLPFVAYVTGRKPKMVPLWCVSIFYLLMMLSVGGQIGTEFGEHGCLIVQVCSLLIYVLGLTSGLLANLIKQKIVSLIETS